MRHHPEPTGRRCRPTNSTRPGRSRCGEHDDRCGTRRPAGGPYPPSAAPRVRFTPSAIPVLTCTPARHEAALRGAAEALARLGRSDLGGSLRVSAPGPVDAAAERLAARRAVENALHGGCGSVLLPPPYPPDRQSRDTTPPPGPRPATPYQSEELR
ncbi:MULTISPECIES: hypothetical protein [Micromonospora]|uniref:Uncharacterized protein n=1 Tax=Verrucosispora sp. MS100047 TaxID=1410949 RepID=A0A097CS49_9ACTN|nr:MULTISPECIES: hypothetical protein [Micromonospora]AEB46093.1 hypothetical protein VAB18032_24975 [Micromonospora maris AB-18-032]AIS85491.1 hypothetical protein VASRM7_252 [Verrucosispora sp. MS100047]RUL94565.1 hypothetical protein EG812_02435 [Verrucosispora sp. FIM060022]WSK41476.1 hypothetical protein OG712_23600 [Micromonospora maris]